MLLFALVAALAVYWLMLHASHVKMREQVRLDAERLAGQTAHALTLQMNTVVRKLDYFSQHLGWIWLNDDITAFHNFTQESIRTLSPQTLAQIAVADAQGTVRYSSLNWGMPEDKPRPAVSIADREHFKVHAQAKESFLFISDPIEGRISRQWTIQFSRGLWDDEGRFQGVLVLSVSATHLATALKAIFPDPTDTAALVKDDGTYLARSYYLADVLGRKLPSNRPYVQHPELTLGTYRAVAAVDQIERFYSWRRVDDYPLVIVVGVGSEKAMALIDESITGSHWQSGVGSALLLIAGLTLAGLWTQRSIRSAALQRIADALAAETSRLSTVLECFPGGVLIKDTNEHVVFVNTLWPELLGLGTPASALCGMHISKLQALMGTESASWLSLPPSDFNLASRSSNEVETAQGRHLELFHIEVLQHGQDFGSVWLVRDITHRKEREQQLARLAATDTLTALPNRRSFMHSLNMIYEAARRDESVTGIIMMLDLDRFKRVNDTYGHAVGDLVLQHVSQVIRASIRATDVLGRFGGEEFVVLQPRTGIKEGLATAERIRRAMENSCIEAEGQEIRVTISIGVSVVAAGSPPETALQQADLALYNAKNSGRNRVCLWEEPAA